MKGYKNNKKIGIVFSGGPAPAANAVISSAVLNFLDKKIPVIGFFHGFEFLEKFDPNQRFLLVEDAHYKVFSTSIARIRNRRGVYLKTSRANPGKKIKTREDLRDPQKNQKLQNILDGLDSLGVGFLITIGGDDTLKTANYLSLMGLPVIHIPKTIDNDYFGIPWTFGYWSAVQMAQESLLNLRADSESTDSYFIVEMMGRKAGWLTYAAGVAGESILSISVEDITEDTVDLDKLVKRIVNIILTREKQNKFYGVITVAESIADKLPENLRPKQMDKHGNVILGSAEVGRILRDRVLDSYRSKTGRNKKIIYKQIGYETRNIVPISFDVVLGSMLGYGAWKLFKENKFNSMVSVSDNFQVVGVPFADLIDEKTLFTKLRDVPRGSDFYILKEALSYKSTED
jgi:6-phosphofructokinase 1